MLDIRCVGMHDGDSDAGGIILRNLGHEKQHITTFSRDVICGGKLTRLYSFCRTCESFMLVCIV